MNSSFGAIPRDQLFIVGEVLFANLEPEITVPVAVNMPTGTDQSLKNLWQLPESCPVMQKDPSRLAGIGGRSVLQTGGPFVLHSRTTTGARPTKMNGGKFVVEIQGR